MSAGTLSPLLVLASASPRRRELLRQMGVTFSVQVSDIDETQRVDESPVDYVQRMALEKACHVAGRLKQPAVSPVVLGADTIVVVQDRVLGKPTDRDDALRMLQLLSGRTHEVLSAVAVARGERLKAALSCTRVKFRKLVDAEMLAYWNTGEPRGKAGAYAVQGLGGMFVKRVEGSYTGVVGLPVFETAELLRQFGVPTGLQSGLAREDADE